MHCRYWFPLDGLCADGDRRENNGSLFDLVTVLPTRKKPSGQVETFSLNVSDKYEEVQVRTEDYGAVLFKMDNGAHGMFSVSRSVPAESVT